LLFYLYFSAGYPFVRKKLKMMQELSHKDFTSYTLGEDDEDRPDPWAREAE
jgi:hypothetical protein